MPEYSGTTITPADAVQTPAMNGATPGNYTLAALRDFILASKGQANGLASLGADGKLAAAQIPASLENVLFYATKNLLPSEGVENKIYVVIDEDFRPYAWDVVGEAFEPMTPDLSDYATKAEVQAADATLQSQMDNLDHRLENIEQSKGDYIVSAYKDGSITPSGKGKWCVVEGVEGVSRVENQLCNSGDYTNSSRTDTRNFFRPRFQVNGTNIYSPSDITTAGVYTYLFNYSSGSDGVMNIAHSGAQTNLDVAQTGVAVTVGHTFVVQFKVVGADPSTLNGLVVEDFIITDLNIYFNTTDLSFLGATDSAKLATIQKDYPFLLLPSDYGTRIVDWTGNGVRAWSRNLVDIPTTTWASDGSKTFSIDIPIGTYTLSMTSSQARAWIAYLRDSDGEITQASSASSASGRQSVTFTLTRKATTLTVYVNGATVMSDVQLEEGSSATTYTPYHAPNTLSFPSTSLKSAGSVREKKLLNVEVEIDGQKVQKSVKTNPLGEYTITGSESFTAWGSCYQTQIGSINGKSIGSYDMPNILLPSAVSDFRANLYDGIGSGKVSLNVNILYVSADVYANWSNLVGKKFYYELATPNPDTYSDPILDNTLLTEAYGRFSTVQTGTVVDGIADLGFITL